MDKALYIGMTAAKQTMQAQALNSHNLANVSTTGFRQDFTAAREAQIAGSGHNSRANVLVYGIASNMTPGAVNTTGNTLDVAIRGNGWIAVQAPDGSEAYTRRGDLQVGLSGLLETAAGHLVLGDSGPVAVPEYSSISIGSDGTVSIVPKGQSSAVTASVDRIKLVELDNNELRKDKTGLFKTNDGLEREASANVQLVSGALESSNVNGTEAMVTMIQLARQFELQIKLMDKTQEMAQASEKLLRAE
ncbi:MAG: flagellar basal body rod protein FlgF [Pseudomonadales bacterium]|nr:flagellar basal body rod protein FlgF [Pseudomonadales bacterium]